MSAQKWEATALSRVDDEGLWVGDGIHIHASGGRLVAVVPNIYGEGEDVARVITAAPVLLAAVLAAIEHSDRVRIERHAGERTDGAQAVYDQCAAAVALATGGQ